MLPREAWANWLLCAVANAVGGTEHFTFITTDPVGGDGVISDTKTDETWLPTSQSMPTPYAELLHESRLRRSQLRTRYQSGSLQPAMIESSRGAGASGGAGPRLS
jgi:hypothetical protein